MQNSVIRAKKEPNVSSNLRREKKASLEEPTSLRMERANKNWFLLSRLMEVQTWSSGKKSFWNEE